MVQVKAFIEAVDDVCALTFGDIANDPCAHLPTKDKYEVDSIEFTQIDYKRI